MKYRLGTLIEFKDGNVKRYAKIAGVRINGAGTSYEVPDSDLSGSFVVIEEDSIDQVYYPQRKSKPRKKKELAHGTES